MSKVNKELIGAALQLGFEYSDYSDEYLYDWFAMFSENGETPPYDYYDLQDMVSKVIDFKNEGLSYKEVEAKLLS